VLLQTAPHTPLHPMTRSEKPWISKRILKSIKTKKRLFLTYFKSNDLSKKAVYKKYLNKLTHIKFFARLNYSENLIKTNQKCSSQAWSIIKDIIDCKKASKKSKLPIAISVDNVMTNTTSQIFLDKLYDYFANIDATMLKNIPHSTTLFQIHDKSCLQSFVF